MKRILYFTIMFVFCFTSTSFALSILERAIQLRTKGASTSHAGSIQDSLPQSGDTANDMKDRARNISFAQIRDRIEDNLQIPVPNNPDPSPTAGGNDESPTSTNGDGITYDNQGRCVSGPFSTVTFSFGTPYQYGWPIDEGKYYVNPCTGAMELAYDRATAGYTCCCTFNPHPPYDTIICPHLFSVEPGICSTVQCSSSYDNSILEDTPGASADFADFIGGISQGSYITAFTNFQYNPPGIDPGLSGMDLIQELLDR